MSDLAISQLAKNLKYYRAKHQISQGQLATQCELKRSNIQCWEQGKSHPFEYNTRKLIAGMGIDRTDLFDRDLETLDQAQPEVVPFDARMDAFNQVELIEIAAGGLPGTMDITAEMERNSQQMAADGLIVVRVKGESMLPHVHPDALLTCKRVDSVHSLKMGQRYLVDTKDEGGVLKRIMRSPQDDGSVILSSDNPDKDEFPDYAVAKQDILRIWEVKNYYHSCEGLPY
ncbi:S24 family peptidase [Pontibacter sp. G13]|uniref:XRE family transcriptional regulator n=1 Tax=Pontibacter sp. G13 TaxID=3074898 RepID=UPI00288B8C5C|nr:S24 family peptidase [Pontibacter sp. G13]WNJ17425.1 S24 family peptidase [Pontibacter sp. G13]